MRLGRDSLRRAWACDKKKNRRKLLAVVAVTVIVFAVCIGFRYGNYDLAERRFIPLRYYYSLLSRTGLSLPQGGRWWQAWQQLTESFKGWDYAMELDHSMSMLRLKSVCMAFAAGAGLAVAGGIFQTIYKNPMASPNMIGATVGVQMGNMLMVSLYASSALGFVALRYRYCYLFTAVCVGFVILLGRIAGDRKGNPSVLHMVIAGSVLSQGLGTFTMYGMTRLTDENLLVYQEINMGTNQDLQAVSLIVFFVIMGGSLLPMLLLRYRLNIIGVDDSEGRASGVNPAPYRLAAQICGVLMTTAAMVHCGEAGMLALVIPYLVRGFAGADFKKVFTYSALFGGVLMMACRTVSESVLLHDSAGNALTDATGNDLILPVTFLVNIFLTPVFIVILAKQRSGFE